MTAATTQTSTTIEAAPKLFERVVVGIDRSPESLEAARQAAILAEDEAPITLLGAWEPPAPTTSVLSALPWPGPELDVSGKAAEEAVSLAKRKLGRRRGLTAKIAFGVSWKKLIQEAGVEDATLIAIGSHGQGRMRGIMIGSTGTEVIHKAHCSVLIARRAGPSFPRRLVVGLDGSPESVAAFRVAEQLATRFGGKVRPIVAYGGVEADMEAVAQLVEQWEGTPDDAVYSLVAASADADLLVVGSRGLHGVRALGSVSERVAHRAHCSTLIVRPGLEAGND
jgi:nucleotide-binding universal stress UspA family protein